MPKQQALTVKPVIPRPSRTHGFFGIPFFKEHIMMDKRWEPNALKTQFKGMTNLLGKHLQYKRHENAALKKRYRRSNRALKQQCRDGRAKLQLALHGENAKKIHNYLLNYKDMQRLYQKMPVQMVVTNINQRTFVLRKERDRLRYRLSEMIDDYKGKLIARAEMENRVKYQNEFLLDEEVKAQRFRNLIENSVVRLNAIKTINVTYRRIIEVLRNDAIFYEPILRSLDDDQDDQMNFAKYIVALGTPAITKFQDISAHLRKLEEKNRKAANAKALWVSKYREEKTKNMKDLVQAKQDAKDVNLEELKRYVRETPSMLRLKEELEKIEATIKRVKFVTLCSKAKEVYPRIRIQVDNNESLRKNIAKDMITHEYLDKKLKRADVLRSVLVNNLSEEEIRRIDHIKELHAKVEDEDEQKAEMIAHLKERAAIFVMLRYTLWNMNEILRHVGRPMKTPRRVYPTADLKLPLLKFENLVARAYPPDNFEENIATLLKTVNNKVQLLMTVYRVETSQPENDKYRDNYHEKFLESKEIMEMDAIDNTDKQSIETEEDPMQELKIQQSVPNRKQIKLASEKIYEEMSKRDD